MVSYDHSEFCAGMNEDVYPVANESTLLLCRSTEWMPCTHLRELLNAEARQSVFASSVVSTTSEASSAPTRKAALLLHCTDSDGHQFITETKADPQWHLQVHNGQLSVLPGEQTRVAKFDQT